jgi:hypothetical protein
MSSRLDGLRKSRKTDVLKPITSKRTCDVLAHFPNFEKYPGWISTIPMDGNKMEYSWAAGLMG